MRKANIRFTYHDYLMLPEDKRYEILDGDLCMAASPNIKHQRISQRLLFALVQHVEKSKLGEVFNAPCDVVLSEENVVQPDIMFVSTGRGAIVGEKNLQGVPDLAIEILSDASRKRDLEIKRKIYARFGIREYWIVDPDAETIEVLVLSEIGYLRHGAYKKADCLSSPLLPSLQLQLSSIF
jgi:Uma2 family endonuclease